jgi:hypothetical protein
MDRTPDPFGLMSDDEFNHLIALLVADNLLRGFPQRAVDRLQSDRQTRKARMDEAARWLRQGIDTVSAVDKDVALHRALWALEGHVPPGSAA